MTIHAGRHAAHYEVREDLVARLRRELLGPDVGASAEERAEVLDQDAPITRYPMGVLFPRPADAEAARRLEEDEHEQNGPDGELVPGRESLDDSGETVDRPVAGVRRPSSVGLTFAVDPAVCREIVVSARAAVYEPEDAEGRRIPARRSEARTTSDQRERWCRVELDLPDVTVDVTRPGRGASCDLVDGMVRLEVHVRRPSAETGTVTVTVALVNVQRVGERELQDAFALFQPGLVIRAADGSSAFVERPAALSAADPELETGRLLHRHAPTFATGHGCAAVWDWEPVPVGLTDVRHAGVTEVRTEFLPTHEVLLTDSNPEIDDRALTMLGLAEAPDAEVLAALEGLAAGYEQWIERKRAEAAALAGTAHEEAAAAQVAACGEALDRIRQGIALLRDKPDLMRAFRLANQAMAVQRSRSAWIKADRVGEPDLASARWRPFQIAFVLLCLAGVDDPEHPDRGVSDLLWFPTGGGKTEAYLGLIALTTFLRRMRRGAAGGGVTVLMRYTLRLLTLQQFERAAILICAMERMRRANPADLGQEEISLGMWVGQSATPNTLEAADRQLVAARSGRTLQTENPVQLHACPWCGTALDAHHYSVDRDAVRMDVRCPGTDCAFSGGLPVHLIDETVYRARPTLVIATVDKFASMPWRPQTAALFNRDRQDTTPPPELIVQDELHLISGPLGTLTGLYETAVDVLADRPKVIASTATIRRAGDQGRALFCREVRQFPPAGLDARDSWFAVETPAGEKASRRYVGLFAPGTSQSTLLIRTYATLLHQAMRTDTTPQVRDAYWTLVGYFNSLRLLSAAELQVHDDVVAHLEHLAERDGCEPRSVGNNSELTSRVDASDIPARLKQIERRLPGDDVVDVLLATNMIAVGVDVDRLGLMAVMGQPQTTAEYIQATSRVGRAHPGLVAVMLNATRPRDRSHYENFQHFHSALYREVESTSVTPFSARARDRGLHAVIVSLARILIPAARADTAAGDIDLFVDELRERIRPMILERVAKVSPEATAAKEVENVGAAFDEFVDWWYDEAERHGGLHYEPKRGRRVPSLLKSYNDALEDVEAWGTLWSLRDVDAESALFMEASR
ncbi:DNA helicase [Streptomyces mobaraensis NBRC 13819 = DSM 40847]|uniref:DNA helicase n=1 Tax=Streptomyces mobaraensis (strain ATCC 29032 / DSM 40847 / JCM 4168 / NBRC 13819 / NCIMB 11159 / IPCR 16-22) TaxID=1223523 RepID=M3C6L7_STRM1|nr:helicase-related protein [Streptomyces mobaraensis]EME99576.1 DNA helicase [Streptomyces mobaraensis NBRC 13819 = DSM 40847]QTT76550.1 DNA helicase [Streptomyces mobaraensis NBRC 13819 = DSM 40847]